MKIKSNNREYQISFCKYCSHAVFSMSTGLECGIDKNYQNFEIKCDYFDKDLRKIRQFKSSRAIKSSSLEIIKSYIQKLNQKEESTIELRISTRYILLTFYSMILIIIFTSIYFYTIEKNILASILTIIVPPVLFSKEYILLSEDYRKTKKMGPVLILTEKGIQVNGEFKSWEYWVGYRYYREKKLGSLYSFNHWIEFEFIGKIQDPILDIDNLTVSRFEVIKLLNRYFDKHVYKHIK